MPFATDNRPVILIVFALLVSTLLFPFSVSGQTISIEIQGTPSTWTLNPPHAFVDSPLSLNIISDSPWQVTAADSDISTGKPNNGYLSNWSPLSGYETATGLTTHLYHALKVQVGSGSQVANITSAPLVLWGTERYRTRR